MIGRVASGIYRWLDDRLEISKVVDFAYKNLTKPVPKHVNWLFSFGTVTLTFFTSQFLSGLLLMVYYEASAESAYDSVKFIMEKVRFGWLVRQIHSYGANFMIAFLFLHAIRVFFYGGYKKPREVTWLFGFALLAVTLGFGFTGYLLPWDQLSYWGTTVGTEIAGTTPVIGSYLLVLLRGGETVSEVTLTRFFAVHVIVLPWIFAGLVTGHLFLIRYKGISPLASTDLPEPTPEEIKKAGGKAFYPKHVLKEGSVVLLVLAFMLLMIVYTPLPLHEKADPFNTPVGVKPEWYFLSMYQALKYVPKLVGILGSGLVILALLLLPFWERSPERHPARRPVAVTLGILFVVANIALALLAKLSETEHTFLGTRYHFDTYGWPSVVADPVLPSATEADDAAKPEGDKSVDASSDKEAESSEENDTEETKETDESQQEKPGGGE
ncbi:MAG: cytochrome b N-terminal domain-containing protein [candidate division Zixibacteria bacterium]|nr:cytochrome b N-terminal domain-containing protein [candidate division Zixibacteria bacterium]